MNARAFIYQPILEGFIGSIVTCWAGDAILHDIGKETHSWQFVGVAAIALAYKSYKAYVYKAFRHPPAEIERISNLWNGVAAGAFAVALAGMVMQGNPIGVADKMRGLYTSTANEINRHLGSLMYPRSYPSNRSYDYQPK